MCGREWVSHVLLFRVLWTSKLNFMYIRWGLSTVKLTIALLHDLNQYICLLESILMKLILSTSLTSYILFVFLPVWMHEFHHATLGVLWRMWPLSGADFSSQRGFSSQERGCILTATSDVTMQPPPHPLTFFSLVANPQLWGAALVQEGNYLSTPITSIPAILLTSAPDESPLPTVQEFLDQSREWSPCTLLPTSQHMEYGMLCWQPGSASLHAKSHG